MDLANNKQCILFNCKSIMDFQKKNLPYVRAVWKNKICHLLVAYWSWFTIIRSVSTSLETFFNDEQNKTAFKDI